MLMALAVATVQACPNKAGNHSKSAMSPTPPPSHASIVAWKPRPWTPAASANGLVISIDPVDGTRGMPAPGALGPLAPVADEAPVATYRRANGSVRAALDDRFAEFAVVQIGSDGRPTWTCVHGTKGAAEFMKHPVAKSNPAPAPGTLWEEK
ncbi:MAG TPA: hypothetical protein VJN72_10490 [Gaiellales bacterium]|nr:hypothetical protein [Gaiellales bacterium]